MKLLFSSLTFAVFVMAVFQNAVAQSGHFPVDRISCRDKSPSETQTMIDAIMNHKDGDIFLVNHLDTLLHYFDKIARQGNPSGMYLFGAMLHEKIALGKTFDERLEHVKRDAALKNLTNPIDPVSAYEAEKGMTYIYIAAFLQGSYKQKAIAKKAIFENKYYRHVVKKAKANAAAWKSKCEEK